MAKIKVTMQQSYNNIVFGFQNCAEAGKFMDIAMEAAAKTALKAGMKVSFAVEAEEPEGQEKAPEEDGAGEAGGEDA